MNTEIERQKVLEDLGLETMSREYAEANADALLPDEGAEATRRYYRRFTLVQEVVPESMLDAGAGVACRKGCSYCCHDPVTAPPHEVLTLADSIRRMPAPQREQVMKRVARNAERVDRAGQQALLEPMRCALLEDDDVCSAYDDRPSNCRRFHSMAVADCENSFFNPQKLRSKIRLSTPLLVASIAQYAGFRRLLSERALDVACYELNTALREALADPKRCSQQFAAGDPAFERALRCEERSVN